MSADERASRPTPKGQKFAFYATILLCSLSTFCHNAEAKQHDFGTLQQSHHFDVPVEELDPSDAVLLYGVFPTMAVANAVVLTGNIVALVRKKQARTWGGVGLVVGLLTGLGAPLLAGEGIGWVMLPLGLSATVLALGITNLVLGARSPAQKAKPMESRPSGKTGGSIVLLLAATQ